MQSDWPFRLPGQVQVRHEFTRVGARAAKKGGREKTIKVCWWRFTNYSYTKREHQNKSAEHRGNTRTMRGDNGGPRGSSLASATPH